MITAGNVWAEIASELHRTTDGDLDQIKASCQLAYWELIPKAPWESLRREIELDFANADVDHTMLLPANLCQIEAVIGHNHIDYLPGSRYGSMQRPTYAYMNPQQDALAVFTDVSVVSLSNTWTGGTWDAAYIGEFIRFGDSPNLYQITAQNTFTPRFYADNQEMGLAFIRPAGTRRIVLKDECGNHVKPKVVVYFWEYPLSLYFPEQEILLPASRPLELLTFIRMLGGKDRRESDADRYRAEYKDALADMIAMNPRMIVPKAPTNSLGQPVFCMNHRGGVGRSYNRLGRP